MSKAIIAQGADMCPTKISIKMDEGGGNSPGGPVKTPCSQCTGHRFDLSLGNWDPMYCMAQPKKIFLIKLK